jgi:hypothetical protein
MCKVCTIDRYLETTCPLSSPHSQTDITRIESICPRNRFPILNPETFACVHGSLQMLQNHPSFHVGPSPHEYTINYGRIADDSGFARSQRNEISRKDPVTNLRSLVLHCFTTCGVSIRLRLQYAKHSGGSHSGEYACMEHVPQNGISVLIRPGARLINLLIRGKAHFPSRHSLWDTCSLDSQAASMADIHINTKASSSNTALLCHFHTASWNASQ